MMKTQREVFGGLCAAGLFGVLALAMPTGARASETKGEAHETAKASAPPAITLPKDDYCANIADLAADARIVLQTKTLEDLQRQIDQKIALLEAKRAESEEFLKKRDEANKGMQKGLLDIFSKMKPDVAAAQLEILDVATAAAILKQLNSRVAGTILNEMKAPIAAAITVTMTESMDAARPGNGT
jgi:flagellar motility protein MotE (MotC chaperone)